jgi:hypothetical protein
MRRTFTGQKATLVFPENNPGNRHVLFCPKKIHFMSFPHLQ